MAGEEKADLAELKMPLLTESVAPIALIDQPSRNGTVTGLKGKKSATGTGATAPGVQTEETTTVFQNRTVVAQTGETSPSESSHVPIAAPTPETSPARGNETVLGLKTGETSLTENEATEGLNEETALKQSGSVAGLEEETSLTENEAVVGLDEETVLTEGAERKKEPLLGSTGDIPRAAQAKNGPACTVVIMANEQERKATLLAESAAEIKEETLLGAENAGFDSEVQAANDEVCISVAEQQAVASDTPLTESVVEPVGTTSEETNLTEEAAPVKQREIGTCLTESAAQVNRSEETPLTESVVRYCQSNSRFLVVPTEQPELETSLTEESAAPARLTEERSLTESTEAAKEDGESEKENGDPPQLQTLGRYHLRRLNNQGPWSHYLTHPPRLDGSRRHVDSRRLHIPDHSKPGQRTHLRVRCIPCSDHDRAVLCFVSGSCGWRCAYSFTVISTRVRNVVGVLGFHCMTSA